MAEFSLALKRTLGFEGGYSDNAADPGGKTSYGITEALARRNGYTGEMRDLPLETAAAIYRREFWAAMNLGLVRDQAVASEIYDAAVNMGRSRAAKWAQRAVNGLCGDRAPIKIDGRCGPVTVSAINLATTDEIGRAAFLHAIVALRGTYYLELVELKPGLRVFARGWLANRVTHE